MKDFNKCSLKVENGIYIKLLKVAIPEKEEKRLIENKIY